MSRENTPQRWELGTVEHDYEVDFIEASGPAIVGVVEVMPVSEHERLRQRVRGVFRKMIDEECFSGTQEWLADARDEILQEIGDAPYEMSGWPEDWWQRRAAGEFET